MYPCGEVWGKLVVHVPKPKDSNTTIGVHNCATQKAAEGL